MAEKNTSIISISSTDEDDMIKACDQLDFTSTPKKKEITTSPLKVLDLSWASQGDQSINWDQTQTIVISDYENMIVDIVSPENQKAVLIKQLNYIMAIRSGLHFTMTQIASELVNVETEIGRMKAELTHLVEREKTKQK